VVTEEAMFEEIHVYIYVYKRVTARIINMVFECSDKMKVKTFFCVRCEAVLAGYSGPVS
jgi:hypothetical protein